MEPVFKTDKRIRLGIWGLGRGSSFVNAAKALNIDVVAGCDINKTLCDKFRRACPDAFVTSDENEFLSSKGLDAVLIATFFPSHAEHTIRALEAGLHVMCEVTSFFTPAEGVRVVEAVEKSGKVYNLLENYPFSKENMYLANLWKSGFFGDFMYGEFEYLHECRMLCYSYNQPGFPPVEPGFTVHKWRSWLDFHYYNTHSLGPLMKIIGERPEAITAFPAEVPLPGYLPNSGMGKVCPSLVRMSNGGVMRNLTGATTGDYHTGKRIWGTRASAESIGSGLFIRAGAAGHSSKLAVEPVWPELGELADLTDHGGGDFWELYYFAREVLTGIPAPWDIYSSCDVTLAGLMAARSRDAGGIPQNIPDFRNRSVREKYRDDNHSMPHFDPERIFPEEHDPKITMNFSGLMLELCRDAEVLRKASDGSRLYKNLKDDSSRLTVLKALEQALERLPVFEGHRKEARRLIDLYPDSMASSALSGILELETPEFSQETETVKKFLLQCKAEILH